MGIFKDKKSIFFYRRQSVLVVFFILMALLISGRLFYLQVFKGNYYEVVASDQHRIEQVLLQRRGEVFTHNSLGDELMPLIVNKKLSLVYAVPSEIINPRQTAQKLATIFEDINGECQELLPAEASEELINKCQLRKELEDDIYNKVSKENDPYEPIRNKVDEATVNLIRASNVVGIYFEDEWVRYYSEKERAAQISGFLGYNRDGQVGQYGVEGYFDEELTGEAGKILGDKDLFGRIIPVGETELTQAQDGENIVLTLDKTVQDKAYEIIKQAVEDYGAENGSIIVMEPQSGKIKAMVGYPSFDPNNYNEVENIEVYKNFNISEPYEPGSIFKIITMAIGLDSGAVEVDDKYFDEGFVQVGKYKINNADNEKYGEVSMVEILENSINSGAVHIAFETGKDTFNNYIEKFGFNEKNNIGLVGEILGNFSSLDKRGDIYLATASYGQGITATPLQMAAAMSTIVNNGKLVKPLIIEKIGEQTFAQETVAVQVISPKTADIVKAMMVSVVKNGHGGQAGVDGYYIGGKTGTAEIASVIGGYSNENNHSFIGFGPLDNTKFVVMVKLANPKWGRFSAVTAAPTFAKMASFLLQYYKIAPEIEL